MDDFKKRLKEIKEHIIKDQQEARQGREVEKPPESEETKENLSEEELFLKEMEGVKRYQFKNIVPKKKIPPSPSPYDEDKEIMNTLRLLVDGKIEFRITDTVEYIEGYNIRDYDPNVLMKLKRGEIAYQDYLDLHGTTREEAKDLVKNFIENSRRKGYRCILIVHGKGIHSKDYIPVIKEALKSWLTGKSIGRHILAFCSAKPKDGGTGAIYVLLRK